MEEEAAAAAAAVAGGWVIPAPLNEDIPIPQGMENRNNRALRNVYCSVAIMVNAVWRRRRLEHTARNLTSYRKETTAIRRNLATLRASANMFSERAVEKGDEPFIMPHDLQDALAAVEINPAGAGGAEGGLAPEVV